MMVDRRLSCNTKNPICMTTGFMFGMIIGSLLHTSGSWLQVGVSVLAATVVFHFSYVRNFSMMGSIKQVFKKGS